MDASRNLESLKAPIRKRASGWQPTGLSCVNCAHFKSSKAFLRDSLPQRTKPFCTLLEFVTMAQAYCNYYERIS